MLSKTPAACAAVAILALLSSTSVDAAAASDPAARESCGGFAPREVRNGAHIDRVQPGEADKGQGDTCVIHGSIVSSPTSTINFRVDLPAKNAWNTKLMMIGGGGFDGFI